MGCLIKKSRSSEITLICTEENVVATKLSAHAAEHAAAEKRAQIMSDKCCKNQLSDRPSPMALLAVPPSC